MVFPRIVSCFSVQPLWSQCLGPRRKGLPKNLLSTHSSLSRVHTWIYYSHVILHMEEVANIEFVQIGGVL